MTLAVVCLNNSNVATSDEEYCRHIVLFSFATDLARHSVTHVKISDKGDEINECILGKTNLQYYNINLSRLSQENICETRNKSTHLFTNSLDRFSSSGKAKVRNLLTTIIIFKIVT